MYPCLGRGMAQCAGMWSTNKNDGDPSVVTRKRMNLIFVLQKQSMEQVMTCIHTGTEERGRKMASDKET
jgi:hypothetical protein